MYRPAPDTVGDLPLDEFERRLRGDGCGIRVGPFEMLLGARVRGLPAVLHELYRDYPLVSSGSLFSCRLGIRELRAGMPRRFRRSRFLVDGRPPHEDMPVEQALPVLEWGINLVIALRFHRFLMLHSAVLERNGCALLLPAAPGHGKTTLCAALAHRGWRLLSDEFGLVRPESGAFIPIPRPMPLKNQSIAVMRSFAPEAYLGPEVAGTRKGTVAHVRPPRDSMQRLAETAAARWIVFPRWERGARLTLRNLPPTEAFMGLATNAFNYEVHGEAGFTVLRDLVEGSRCYRLVYSDLDEAVASLGSLADGP